MTTSGPDEPKRPEAGGEEPVQEGPPPTPFDHPYFLPVILLAMTLWFGYDGFISTDPDMQEHLLFNRVGFGILGVLTLWYGYKGYQEQQQIQNEESSDAASGREER